MENTYTISKHASLRYTERLLNKEDNNEIQRFIIENEEKIKTDLNKMIAFGQLIYTGKTAHKDCKNPISVFIKDHWVILADEKSKNIVTVFKIDLGCGDDFNNQYISKMMEKLEEKQHALLGVQLEVDEESKMYAEMIDDSKNQINEFKSMINNLEGLCQGYQTIIDNNKVRVNSTRKEVENIINTLIGKKEF